MHHLINEDSNIIASFKVFNSDEIKQAIISHLKQFPQSEIEHCKDMSKSNQKKYIGYDTINWYSNNPTTGEPCKQVIKGNKTFYKPIALP